MEFHVNEASFDSEFDEFRVKCGIARDLIADSMTPLPLCNKIKIFLLQCFPELEGKLADVDDVEGVMDIIKMKCTIINITPLQAIAGRFQFDDAKMLIKKYEEDLDIFCHEKKLQFVLGKDLSLSQTSAHGEIIIKFVLDWKPDEHKLQDIRRLLGRAFQDLSKRIIVQRIGEGNSIIIICYAPRHLLDALLLEGRANIAVLIEEFKLIRLRIGYFTVYNRDKV